MIDKNKIPGILEIFFECVNLPIKAVNLNGEILGEAGFSPYNDELFISNKILEQALNGFTPAVTPNSDNHLITISCPYNVHFSIQYTSILTKEPILYILGPYLTLPMEYKNLIYKPSHCIPHIFSLLSNISKELIGFTTSTCCCNKRKYNHYINKAIDYIHENYAEPLTIESLANHLNINKCYFCSLFKKETGQTFSSYLNTVRVEKSKELLLNNKNLSILDVAISVGFNNQSYYNSIFKKLNNKTPLELRKT